MKLSCVFLAAVLISPAIPAAAQSRVFFDPALRAEGIFCRDFQRNPDGSWSPIRKVTILGTSGPFSVEPYEKFNLDSTVMSVNISEILDSRCLLPHPRRCCS
jgi:hypothetical protein